MNIEVKGRIVGINETIVVSESFSKREFKVVTNETYPNTYKPQVTLEQTARGSFLKLIVHSVTLNLFQGLTFPHPPELRP